MFIVLLDTRTDTYDRQSRSRGRCLFLLLLWTVVGQVRPLVTHLARTALGIHTVRVERALFGEMAGFAADEADGVGQGGVGGRLTAAVLEPVLGGTTAEAEAGNGRTRRVAALRTLGDHVSRLAAAQTYLPTTAESDIEYASKIRARAYPRPQGNGQHFNQSSHGAFLTACHGNRYKARVISKIQTPVEM